VHDVVIGDRLGMLVTCDPVAELDDALVDAGGRLRAARASGDTGEARRLPAWIDRRLDERLLFQRAIPARP